ncbi:MAG: cupin domain-containing protein [Eubacteriales bacterium]|nr:cupin domain-containing protein [Eubacteriales bacterium]
MLVKKHDVRIEERKNLMGGKNSVFSSYLLELPDFKGAGRLFHKIVIPPMSEIGYHTHKGDSEAYFMLKGEGLYDNDGEKVRVAAGDLMFTPDGCGHGLYNDTDSNIEMIALVLYNFTPDVDVKSLKTIKKAGTLVRGELNAPFGGKGVFWGDVLLEGAELTGAGRVYKYLHMLPDCELGYHEHKGETEVFYILGGKGIFVDDGVEKEVEEGDVCITPDGHSHGLYNPNKEDLVYIAVIYQDKE